MSKKSIDPERVDDDSPEWIETDMRTAVRLDGLPESLQRKLRGQRGLQKAPRKIQTVVRYDVDIIDAFKAGGAGWQTRMNQALREWLRGREKV
ncbi:BrnA antitoxin family protein [Castellaniella denitrificans]|uniref:BrnA antitoxin family protein n=1 Tax=Castellaniella denitrificans TaxID=56119 RepID=UPI001AD2C4D7|nr:BrnA antitoxin family protein [Burkholderiales bacterium]